MLNWDQTDKLYETAQDCTKSADERFREISDMMREWHSAVHMGPITSDYIESHETTHSTHSAPISPYQAVPAHSGNIGAHGFMLHIPYSS